LFNHGRISSNKLFDEKFSSFFTKKTEGFAENSFTQGPSLNKRPGFLSVALIYYDLDIPK